ncbi:MAG: hypothetical protein IPO27_05190 [Bacteroidetes bacterium]|nr:hypothetical protein [Bacteroidota bacterium]
MLEKEEILLLKEKWNSLVDLLCKQFDSDLDLQGIIFLIGVQELGIGYKKYTKDQKQDLMHIATCKLMSYYGYYELEGADGEGWPHWKLLKQLPKLSLKEQDVLLKNSVIQYFEEMGYSL